MRTGSGYKIDPALYPKIIKLYQGGLNTATIARRYGVSQTCISDIVRGKRNIQKLAAAAGEAGRS